MKHAGILLPMALLVALSGCIDGGNKDDGGDVGGDGSGDTTAGDFGNLSAKFAERDTNFLPTNTSTTMLGGDSDTFVLGSVSGLSQAFYYKADGTPLQNEFNGDLGEVVDRPKRGLMADIDNDGRDETLILADMGSELKLYVADDASEGLGVIHSGAVGSVSAAYRADDEPKEFALAAGDVDGDNHNEIVVASGHTTGKVYVKVFEGEDGGFAQADWTTYDVIQANHVSVAVTQLDDDSPLEIALLAGADYNWSGYSFLSTFYTRVFALDDTREGLRKLASKTLDALGQPSMDAGDVDGDGYGEFVVGSVDVYNHNHRLQVLGYGSGEIRSVVDSAVSDPDYNDQADDTRVALVDLKGSRLPEIVLNEAVYDNLEATGNTIVHLDNIPMPLRDAGATRSFLNRHAFGDTDGDGDREILAVIHGSVIGDRIARYGFDGGSIKVIGEHNTAASFSVGGQPMLLSGRVEDEGQIVTFDRVENRTVWSDPRIVAAIAAPPAETAYGMDLQDTTAGLALSNSSGTESSFTVGVTAHMAVGISIEDRTFTQSEIEAGVQFEQSFSSTVAHGTETTKTVTYGTTAENDIIVATLIPYRPYVYRPVGATGEVLVMEPGEPVVRVVTLDYFVDNTGFDPVEGYFVHTPGDVDTYMDRGFKDGGYPSDGVSELVQVDSAQEVPQQPGTAGGSIEVSEFSSREFAHEMGISAWARSTAGGVFVEAGVGASVGSSSAVTFGSGTEYSFELGGIPVAQHDADRYEVGMFGHRLDGDFTYTRPSDGAQKDSPQSFHVINFWVER